MSDGPVLDEVALPDPAAGPYGVAAGSDGTIWFTLVHAGGIGRVAPDGELIVVALDGPDPLPMVIAPGPDGAMWFTRNGDGSIGRIDAAGTVTS
jgi:virginiamycin B lyase